jgi:hypothetical protein
VSAVRGSHAWVFIAAVTVNSALFINFCSSVFQCGCVSLWSGADARCTVHLSGARHCPWCAYGFAASLLPWALIAAAQAAISFWPWPMPTFVRLISALAAFPAAGALIALGYGLAAGYWR